MHDLGGRVGFGVVDAPPDEPPFTEPWERSVFVGMLMLSAAGLVSDGSRFQLESIPALRYLTSAYYERWLEVAIASAVDAGFASHEEFEQRTRHFLEDPRRAPEPRMDPAVAIAFDRLWAGGGAKPRPSSATPRYAIGDQVRVKSHASSGHTRRAGYVRGRCGVVIASPGESALPETSAHGLGANPEFVYTVQFDGSELWGDEPGARKLRVSIELWESYLESSEPTEERR